MLLALLGAQEQERNLVCTTTFCSCVGQDLLHCAKLWSQEPSTTTSAHQQPNNGEPPQHYSA